MEYYYYTKWTFKECPTDLDSVGPYHTTLITERTPKEVMAYTVIDGLAFFEIRIFDSFEEMNEFAKKIDLVDRQEMKEAYPL